MTFWIVTVLGIYFVQTLLGPICRWLLADGNRIVDALGSRDQPPQQTLVGKRFERALANMQEAMFLFLPIALLIEMKGIAGGAATTGAMLFVTARALYVPAYATGLFSLRSIVWTFGHVGLVMMLIALLGF